MSDPIRTAQPAQWPIAKLSIDGSGLPTADQLRAALAAQAEAHADQLAIYDSAMDALRDSAAFNNLFDQAQRIAAERDALRAEVEALRADAGAVVAHMEGRQPIKGWLRDNDASRNALDRLCKNLDVARTAKGGA